MKLTTELVATLERAGKALPWCPETDSDSAAVQTAVRCAPTK